MGVEAAGFAVALCAKLDAGDVAEAHKGAAAAALEDDVAELLRGLKLRLRRHGRIQLLAGNGRLRAELAGRHLDILCLNGGAHVGGH